MITTGKSQHISPADFDDWFASARPGDVMTYCTGFLARDRENGSTLPKLGNHVQWVAAKGYGFLMQRRLAEAHFAYLFVRSPLTAAANGAVAYASEGAAR